jgi:hypothetical protein
VKVDVLWQEERRQFNRKLVLLVHVLAAFLTAMIYFSDLDLQRFQYWRRLSGITALWIAAPSLLPYIISAVHSWRTATYDRLRVAAFLLVLIAGTLGGCCAMLGAFGLSLDRSDLLWVFVVQAIVYFWSAEFLFDVD